jgi:hypothetical protein
MLARPVKTGDGAVADTLVVLLVGLVRVLLLEG